MIDAINYQAIRERHLTQDEKRDRVEKMVLFGGQSADECNNGWTYNATFNGYYFEVKFGDCNMSATKVLIDNEMLVFFNL